jgi:eukaryotic-like serine/threonine-protein kinase
MARADSDRHLLFGLLALQNGLIDQGQLVAAFQAWTRDRARSLADHLVARGDLDLADRAAVEALVARHLAKHGGDAHASLVDAAGGEVPEAFEGVDDPEVQCALAALPPRRGHTLISTVAYEPRTRERYTLTHLHAKGGLGQVWLALDGDLGRQVALKEHRPERGDDPTLRDRFLEEARITGQLEHPGIIPVYELARRSGDGPPFYTMRFIRGRTLSETIRDYHGKREEERAGMLDLVGLLTAFVGVCNPWPTPTAAR